jgi:hypothetical protein
LFVFDYDYKELAQLKPFTLDLGKRLIRKNFERSFKDMLLATGGCFRNLMFPLWFTLLGGSSYFSFFWVLWFIYGCRVSSFKDAGQ